MPGFSFAGALSKRADLVVKSSSNGPFGVARKTDCSSREKTASAQFPVDSKAKKSGMWPNQIRFRVETVSFCIENFVEVAIPKARAGRLVGLFEDKQDLGSF